MLNRKKEKKKESSVSEKDYFQEATAWDLDRQDMQIRANRRGWMVAGAASTIAVLQAIGIVAMLPLKTVEPLIIRSDSSTGIVEVVSTIKEKEYFGEDIENRYWLNQYVTHRERWQWETRNEDRQKIGLWSSSTIQQEYADYTDPNKNPYAPVLQYGTNTEVRIETKGISHLNSEVINGEKRNTSLVRYIRRVKRSGEPELISHWAATVTYTYRNTKMALQDRYINPFGFQVISYRIDEESSGGL